MKKGTYVRLLKLIAGPDYEPGSTGAEHHLGITPKATVKPDYWVEGGTHIMVYNRSADVNRIISHCLAG